MALAGTSAASNSASQDAVSRSRITASTIASSSSRFCIRSRVRANRVSSASSGWPMAAQNFFQNGVVKIASASQPSRVRKVPYGTIEGCRDPVRSGARPATS